MSQTTHKTTYAILGGSALMLFAAWSANANNFQAKEQHKTAIATERTDISQDNDFAQERAQTCLLVRLDKPLTDGVAGYYPRRNSRGQIAPDYNRPFPEGSYVCDIFGNTGKVTHQRRGKRSRPVIQDIRAMPPEEMAQILEERGLIQPQGRTYESKEDWQQQQQR